MNTILRSLLPTPLPDSANGMIAALREAMQNLALLGLWRAKFFEVGAFYGGTSLRLLYGLPRFSEDLDFSLLNSMPDFSFQPYENSLKQELESFGLMVTFQSKEKSSENPIKSAFLKANTYQQLILIKAPTEILVGINKQQTLKIKIEVDTNPPLGFETELKYLFTPLPFPVRTYSLPDLFAGKMHALLCRSWQTRVKGRDWYDFLWYVSFHPELNLVHLEERMRQSGHYGAPNPLTEEILKEWVFVKIGEIDIDSIREEVSPFVDDIRTLEGWSKDLFIQASKRIKVV